MHASVGRRRDEGFGRFNFLLSANVWYAGIVWAKKKNATSQRSLFTTTSRLTKRNPFDKKKESAITAKRVGECRRYHLKVRGENQPKNHHLFV